MASASVVLFFVVVGMSASMVSGCDRCVRRSKAGFRDSSIALNGTYGEREGGTETSTRVRALCVFAWLITARLFG